MTQRAIGSFDVKVTPRTPDSDVARAANIGRLTIDKQFHGDLDATSKGEMLAAGDVAGSGGYVAMERVTGTLNKRGGSFVLQHSGTMKNRAPEMSVNVVPDSGTGELRGLSGTMTIVITADGTHSYELEYRIE